MVWQINYKKPVLVEQAFYIWIMIAFKALLKKFDAQGEKTGWTYFVVPKKVAEKFNPGVKKSYRVKGKIDEHPIKAVALVPMGEGDFIVAVNAVMRKAIRKIHGAEVDVQLEQDTAEFKMSKELLECLKDDPDAAKYFHSLPPSHQHWYSNWVTAAKTEGTKSKRIATIVQSCAFKMTFPEMMREYRDKNSVKFG